MKESNTTNPQEIFVKMVLDAWHSKVNQFDNLLSELSDEQLMKEVAPGRNRGMYLLGHLTVLNDSIFPLLGYEKLAPDLWKPFVETADKDNGKLPTVNELRQEWVKVKTALAEKMNKITPGEWFLKHTSVSEEDFVKAPHRNKLNVVLSRISHMDYHLGQLTFLKNNKYMENQNFTTTLVVKQSPEEVFSTLLNVRAWWSGLHDESFEGSSEKVGDEFSFLAGGGVHYTKQKMIELIPNKKVVWLVTEANLSFVDKTDEWKGTKISFEVSREVDKTKIVFTHIGLVPEFECYDSCAPAWTQYVQERLLDALSKTKEVHRV